MRAVQLKGEFIVVPGGDLHVMCSDPRAAPRRVRHAAKACGPVVYQSCARTQNGRRGSHPVPGGRARSNRWPTIAPRRPLV